MLDFNLLEGMLQTKEIGRIFLQFESLQSTHKKARSIINQCPNGMVIFAEEQWNAQTKRGKIWYSPEGGIYFSVIIHSNSNEDFSELLNLILTQSMIDASQSCNEEIQFSVSNALWRGNQKLGCTMVDKITKNQEFSYILDVFLNYDIDPKELSENVKCPATNIKTSVECKLLKEQIVANALNCLEKNLELIYLNKEMLAEFLSKLFENSIEYGKEIQIKKPDNKRWVDVELIDFNSLGRLRIKKQEQIEILNINKYEIRMIEK
ncbi:MAG: hypothetical protein JXQ26_11485 [Tissierellales bacterium]|nr:hypothetical protein [Tissierellales bacterium]MBN2828608.1 hypothetical protein [Tissierellales bacterium]